MHQSVLQMQRVAACCSVLQVWVLQSACSSACVCVAGNVCVCVCRMECVCVHTSPGMCVRDATLSGVPECVADMCIAVCVCVLYCVCMVWLRLVGSLKSLVSFAKEPYKRDNILQKRPIILRSLLIVATPTSECVVNRSLHGGKDP